MSGRRGGGKGGGLIQLLFFRVLYENPLHGYAILEEVNRLLAGRRPIKSGSLYTILRRMEKSGLLTSEWDRNSSRLDRRIYRLTEAGIEKLKRGRRLIEEQKRILNEMTSFYEEHFPESD